MTLKSTILLLLTVFIIACNTDSKISLEDAKFEKYFSDKNNIPIVKGKVLNLSKQELNSTKIEYALVTPFAESHVKKTTELSEDGTFELELDHPFPNQEIWLTVGKYLYAGIYANDELYIEINADSLREDQAYMNAPGINYLGVDGVLNTTMNNRVLYRASDWRNASKATNDLIFDRNSDIDSILVKYDSIYTVLHQLDDEFILENSSPYNYLIKNERLSDYYGGLMIADKEGKMAPELFSKIKAHKAYLVSNNASRFYSSFYSKISTQLDGSIYVGDGMRFFLDFNEHEKFKNYSKIKLEDKPVIEEIVHQNKLIKDSLPYDTLGYKKLSDKAYEVLKDTISTAQHLKIIHYLDSSLSKGKADVLKLQISSSEPKEKKRILETVLPNANTAWCKSLLKQKAYLNSKKLATIKQVLSGENSFTSNKNIGEPIGELAFGAKLYKIENVEAEKLLANIKTAFDGKALLLDFWATWCGPCLGEFPHSKKLYDEMDQKQIEFVYLCTSSGSDIDKWKEKIAEFELGGTHLFIESSIESELMNMFSFSGFPSYAFIDKRGNYKPGAIERVSSLNEGDLERLIETE